MQRDKDLLSANRFTASGEGKPGTSERNPAYKAFHDEQAVPRSIKGSHNAQFREAHGSVARCSVRKGKTPLIFSGKADSLDTVMHECHGIHDVIHRTDSHCARIYWA